MFYGHLAPIMPFWGRTPWGYPSWYVGGYSNSTNIYGSAIASQNIYNTGNMAGVNQFASPTVIF